MEILIKKVRELKPIVHNITNYVTVNDVANALLAIGASPIMADDENEVEEMTSITQALNINIGTLNSRTIHSMLLAGRKAKSLHHPVVLDPVGVGATVLRTNTAIKIIEEVHPDIIKGNISEIKTLALHTSSTKGVDANEADQVNENNLDETIEFIKNYALSIQSTICVTGAIDIVTDGIKTVLIHNGRKEMSTITGTGCQLSGLIAAFACTTDDYVEAASEAIISMGLAGERAYSRLKEYEGNSTYRNKIIDELYHMNDLLGAKYERR